MKNRIRKKYRECNCDHLYESEDLLTTDPYPIYQPEVYCKLRKNLEWYEEDEDKFISFQDKHCQNCRHFTISPTMKKKYNNYDRHVPDIPIHELIESRANEAKWNEIAEELFGSLPTL